MAQHKSAKKRARQNARIRARNRHVRASVRTSIKSARTALDGNETGDITAAVRETEGMLRRAASKGVISKKHASRQVARLAKRAHAANA